MQLLHQHLLQSKVRTEDPDQAQLFFIPVYLGRHFNWFWQQWSAPGNAWDVHEECLPTHTPPECFWDKWDRAKEVRLSALPLSTEALRPTVPRDAATCEGGGLAL